MIQKIGILGGTFDPFTLAHREIVKQVLEQNLVDVVYIVPTIVEYHRGDKLPWLSDAEKIDVIEHLTEGIDSVVIDDAELEKRDLYQKAGVEDHLVKDWRFIDTLLRLKFVSSKSAAKDEFYPIIGGDSLDNFKSWFAWKEILNQSAGLIAVERNNKAIDVENFISENPEFDGKLKAMKIYDGFAEMSASDMRETWRKHQPTEYLDWALATIEADKAAGQVNDREKNLLLHTPIFDVIKGEKTETGLEPVLVNAPDWVTFIIEKDGKFLVEKQFRYGSNDIVEEFPCGMLEDNEDPIDAAVRELEEETGLKILDKSKIAYLGSTSPNPAFMTNMMHYFYIDLGNAEFVQCEQKLDAHEQLTFSWEDKGEFEAKTLKNTRSVKANKVPAILLSAFMLLHFS